MQTQATRLYKPSSAYDFLESVLIKLELELNIYAKNHSTSKIFTPRNHHIFTQKEKHIFCENTTLKICHISSTDAAFRPSFTVRRILLLCIYTHICTQYIIYQPTRKIALHSRQQLHLCGSASTR